ncbi:hypothetical protein BDQ17DRAFT_1545629 [Cyathus striatus]|nr:hypothetical protein BDQ17DRAFT_1545629 [Cyathus striatus]
MPRVPTTKVTSTVTFADKRYECKQCGMEFGRKCDLTRHVKVHSDIVRRFRCEVPNCLFSAHERHGLAMHMNTHTGAKPFGCRFCDICFSDQSSRARHMKRKHSDQYKPIQRKRRATPKIKQLTYVPYQAPQSTTSFPTEPFNPLLTYPDFSSEYALFMSKLGASEASGTKLFRSFPPGHFKYTHIYLSPQPIFAPQPPSSSPVLYAPSPRASLHPIHRKARSISVFKSKLSLGCGSQIQPARELHQSSFNDIPGLDGSINLELLERLVNVDVDSSCFPAWPRDRLLDLGSSRTFRWHSRG